TARESQGRDRKARQEKSRECVAERLRVRPGRHLEVSACLIAEPKSKRPSKPRPTGFLMSGARKTRDPNLLKNSGPSKRKIRDPITSASSKVETSLGM